MRPTITLLDEDVTIDLDRSDFYEKMLERIVVRVLHLLGPEFDAQGFLQEVEKGRSPLEIGQGWAIPVSITLSLELGYCLGQLKALGRPVDFQRALKDLYGAWKTQVIRMLQEEGRKRGPLH